MLSMRMTISSSFATLSQASFEREEGGRDNDNLTPTPLMAIVLTYTDDLSHGIGAHDGHVGLIIHRAIGRPSHKPRGFAKSGE